MPADKPRPTLADYVTLVASPALIMAMIISLVFFLLTIFYRGEYAGRLHYMFFFFIFGIVLVARISMETGLSERAPLYGALLALLGWLSMGKFVSYPSELSGAIWLINAGLIGLAWWLSFQLTYSCTFIDEQGESTGTGVLQAAGLEKPEPNPSSSPYAKVAEDDHAPQENGKRAKKGKATWWLRYQRFRAERRMTQPPGVWVVYFALAALPIFGLGQALIDVADVERRARTFWLMTLYLASSLGLLVTTAFLGLRRYLRQRRLEMPKTVTSAWLVLGAVLVAAFVGVGAVLPRPQAEFSPLTLSRASSQELAASKSALTNTEAGKGEGRSGAQKHDPDDNAKDSGKKAGENRDGQTKQNNERGQAQTDEAPDQPDNSGADLPAWLSPAMSMLKWIVFSILALVAIVFLLGGGLKYLAHFTDWARRLVEAIRRFWEGLFGGGRHGKVADQDMDELSEPTRAPFRTFANPFDSGRATRMTPADLVRYSFEALEAWAGERQSGRHAEESPIEFTDRLADDVPVLEKEAKQVGVLYARVLYARGELPPDWSDTLKKFWERLDAVPSGGIPVQPL